MKTKSVLFWLLSGLLLFCYGTLLVSPAYAVQKRYVSPSGNDSNDGTSVDSAYASIDKAVQELTNFSFADDVEVYIKAGTYPITDNSLFSALNNLTSIKFIGDSDGAIFSSAGGDISFQASDSILITNQTKPLTFQSIIFSCSTQDIIKIQNSSCVTLTQCTLKSTSGNGLSIDSASESITVDRSYIETTATGIDINQSKNIVIQNCSITNNTIGIHWNDTTHTTIMNNFISSNSQYGLKLEDKSLSSVVFNNIIENNTISQIYTNYNDLYFPVTTTNPTTGETTTSSVSTWRSTANAIVPKENQLFGHYNSTPIYNQKQWQEQVYRDYWNASLSYPIIFFNGAPTESNIILGHGIAYSNCFTAPTIDIEGNTRPLNCRDMGCLEILEDDQFHHIDISSDAPRKDPQTAITITVNIKDNAGTIISYLTPFDKPLYLFIHSGDNPTDFDNLAEISGNNIANAAIPGLYKIPINTNLISPFQFTVKRNMDSNSGRRYSCRLIEWDNDWNAETVVYGGRGNNADTELFWTKLPDPAKSTVTVTSAILASGLPEHNATLTVEARDVDGNIIPDLWRGDFSVTATGGTVSFIRMDETGYSNGIYADDHFYSNEVGTRTLTVKVLEQELDQHPTLDVQPGIYGCITSSDSTAPIAGATISVMVDDYTSLASGTADASGRYAVLVPAADNSDYIIRIIDPAGSYPQKDFIVTIPADAAVEENFSLEPIPAHNTLEAHGYPNPAKRGQMITIPYNVPKAGHLNVAIYDLKGREITVIFDGQMCSGQGQFKWPGINKAGKNLAPGTYRLVVKVDNSIATRKIVIVP